jgi:uncharacterized protein
MMNSMLPNEPRDHPDGPARRIVLVDALRGFALAAIFLAHHIERFGVHTKPSDPIGPFSADVDKQVMAYMVLLISGKAYAMFAAMFGFSFWVQMNNAASRNVNFVGRFLWRMLLLAMFGQFHAMFYEGDLLCFYAALSVPLLITRKWSDWAIICLAILFLSQPWFLTRFAYALTHPDWTLPPNGFVQYYRSLREICMEAGFWEAAKAKLTLGQRGNIMWFIESGRMTQTLGLFFLGMLAARRRVFSDSKASFWLSIAFVCLIFTFPLHFAVQNISEWVPERSFRRQVGLILSLYQNVIHVLLVFALICLPWRMKYGRKLLTLLAPFGRMSLTHYLSLNIIGVFIYQAVGADLHHYLGRAMAMCVGLILLVAHIAFSHWWLNRFRYGPLEAIWRKATWIGRAPVTTIKQA